MVEWVSEWWVRWWDGLVRWVGELEMSGNEMDCEWDDEWMEWVDSEWWVDEWVSEWVESGSEWMDGVSGWVSEWVRGE